ncbi:MAG: hypothetical protein K940chlam7_01187, partial [Chlamydiae bacterium]|nr:hypothetical protein [Chlamydiota bacterium]
NAGYSEVLEVRITWSSTACNEDCAKLLSKQFMKIKQVEKVSTNPVTGVTVLNWKPKQPFSYYPIKTTMQVVGVGVNDIRVRVRGKVKEQGRSVVLFSEQDNTRFVLVSPIVPDPERYTTKPNPYLRELTPNVRERILKEAENDKILVIEGPLNRPARSPPLQLVVERIQVEKKKR